jgi:hypothetical protein
MHRHVDGGSGRAIGLEQALRRARADYKEMPGLRLTAAQASRLWALDAPLCATVLSQLVEQGFLTRAANAAFVRAD